MHEKRQEYYQMSSRNMKMFRNTSQPTKLRFHRQNIFIFKHWICFSNMEKIFKNLHNYKPESVEPKSESRIMSFPTF